eukprot:1972098-Rhodomonas_salina.1
MKGGGLQVDDSGVEEYGQCMLRRTCYTMSGTDAGDAATRRRLKRQEYHPLRMEREAGTGMPQAGTELGRRMVPGGGRGRPISVMTEHEQERPLTAFTTGAALSFFAPTTSRSRKTTRG